VTDHPLIKRVEVAEKVAAKFIGQDFAWGQRDCARMAHLVVTGLGLSSPWRKAGQYRSERTAIRSMRKLGYNGLDEALDSMFPRIAPAETLPGDLLGFESSVPQFGVALGLVLSGGKCVAFIDSELVGGCRAVVGYSHFATTAWSVL
jgi:hypothetical protein